MHLIFYRYMMQYLAWRILVGLHRTITISFLIVGHTKFSPDWCFGLFKQRFRRTNVSCLNDIVRVVESSAEVNHTQLVATQDNNVLVPTYNWSQFFEQHFQRTALAGITSFITFGLMQPAQESYTLKLPVINKKKLLICCKTLLWRPTMEDLPALVPPAGLSLERQWYLYDKIREFCNPDVQDVVCPRPACTLPGETQTRSILNQQKVVPPPSKKPRLCSNCKRGGHNRRSRPELNH